MGNTNQKPITIENLNANPLSSLSIIPEDPDYEKEALKNEKQNLILIQKHNKDHIDSDIIENCLINHYLLKELEQPVRQEIIQQLSKYNINSDTEIFIQGDPPGYFYIISNGICEIFIDNEKKEYIGRGSCFGDWALIHNCNREYTIKAKSDCVVWALEKKNFKKIIEHLSNISFGENILIANNFPVLNALNTRQKNLIINKLYIENYQSDKKIYYKNQESACLYLIKEGEVNIKENDNVIDVVESGEYFGLLSLLKCSKRLYNAVCKKKCKIYCMPISILYNLFGENFLSEIILILIKTAFLNIKEFNEINIKFLDEVINYFHFTFYENETEILNKNNKKNEFVIIPIEGKLINSDEDKIVCKKNNLLFADDIYKNNSTNIGFNIKCTKNSIIAKCSTQKIIDYLKCSFEDYIETYSIIKILKKINIFKNLTSEKYEKLIKKVKILKIKSGQNIVTEGGRGNRFFILKNGTVEIYMSKKYIRNMNINEYIGERALLFNNEIRKLTATAKTDIEVYYLDKNDFENVIGNNLKEYLVNKFNLEDAISIQLNDLTYVKNLHKGNLGYISLVKNAKSNFYYVIKSISQKQILYTKTYKNIESEREILQKIDYPFIIKYIKTLKDEKYIYYLLEYIKGNTLYESIREIEILSKNQTQFFISSIMLSIKYLHNKNIIFRNIKPENIMLTYNGFIKLIDFSTAKILKNKTSSVIGTPEYMAPEIILGDDYSFEIDYWSIGICLYEFYCGELPFGEEAEDPMDIYLAIINNNIIFPNFVKDTEFKNLVQLMLNKNKYARYSKFEQISGHNWFKDFEWEKLVSLEISSEYLPKIASKEKDVGKKNFVEYIKNLSEWEVKEHKLKISDEEKNTFEQWIKNF